MPLKTGYAQLCQRFRTLAKLGEALGLQTPPFIKKLPTIQRKFVNEMKIMPVMDFRLLFKTHHHLLLLWATLI